AREAYDKAKASGAYFRELKEQLGPGQLTRIRGQDRSPPRQYARITHTNMKIFAELCRVPATTLILSRSPVGSHTPNEKDGPAPIDFPTYAAQAQKLYDVIEAIGLVDPGTNTLRASQFQLSKVFIEPMARRSRPPQSLPRDWLAEQGVNARR